MNANDEIEALIETLPQGLAVPRGVDLGQADDKHLTAVRTRRFGPVCFKGGIPSSVEHAMAPRHCDRQSTSARMRPELSALPTYSYIHLQENEADVVLRYQIQGRSLQVLSEGVRMGAHDIAVFAEHVLAQHRNVGCIRMYGADTDLALLRMPLLKMPSGRQIAVDLPSNRRSYWTSLNSSIRQDIKTCQHQLARELGEISLLVLEGEDITRAALDTVIDLDASQRSRHQFAGEEDRQKMWELTRQRGFLLQLTIGGRICAGAICLRTGDSWKLDTLARHPELHRYRLDLLCSVLCIEECIKRGGAVLQLPGDQLDPDASLLGRERQLYDLAIYRSRTDMALQPRAAVSAWLQRLRKRTAQ